MKMFVAHDKSGSIKSFFSIPASHPKSGARVARGTATDITVSEVEVPLEAGKFDEDALHRLKEEFQVEHGQTQPKLVQRKKK